MSAPTAPVRKEAPGSTLAPGQVVGGRFAIERAVGDDAIGTILAARDQKTQRPIALRVLAPGLIATPEAAEILRAEVKTAAGLTHRSIVGTYGMGAEKSGARFIACEWVQGQPLAHVVAKKKHSGEAPLTLRAAYNVLAHVAKALGVAHEKGAVHGALRPSVVWLSHGGRVKVAELGVARALLRTAGAASLGATEQPFLAPEVRQGAAPDVRTDVFGMGGLLYTMLTGRTASDEFVPPSSAHPEGTPQLDAVLLRCLATDPRERYATPEEVRAALAPLATGAAEGSAEAADAAVGIDIDVDVDMATSSVETSVEEALPAAAAPKPPAPKPPPPRKPAPPTPAAGGDRPQVGARVSLHEDFRPSLVDPLSSPAAPVAVQPVLSAEVELGQLLSKITENDAARWMVSKEGLDHGPFSGRELVGLIAKGEVLGDHQVLNMDDGTRKKVREYPEFLEFVEQWRLKKASLDEHHAVVTAAKVEKASNLAKFMVAGAVVVGVGLLAGVFFLTRGAEQETTIVDAQLADLYERGEVQIEGTAGILPDPPAGHRRGGGRRGAGGGGGGGGGSSYEDAMSQVAEMGDATGSGGEGRLSPAQVAGTMNGALNSMFGCVSQELRGGQRLGRVRIDIAIAGSGRVLGSTVHAGSPAFQRCVQQRVAAVHFPSFGAPRMGASFSFTAE